MRSVWLKHRSSMSYFCNTNQYIAHEELDISFAIRYSFVTTALVLALELDVEVLLSRRVDSLFVLRRRRDDVFSCL